jgi:iron complex transport system ATP-binding protein
MARSRWRNVPRLPSPAAPGELLAEARAVSVELGGSSILRGTDLDVRAGEVVALIGPNGAGKSTLLGAMAGDVRCDGAVTLRGAELATWSPAEIAMRRAVLPQQFMVTFPFTALDVVQMGRAPWARTPLAELDDVSVTAALDETDTRHLAHRHYPTLSGGERARVALARVLAQQTQLLLLDEPTAALDLHHQELVLDVARARAASGSGVVVVLHDLGVAARHADRIVLLSRGSVVADGPPARVLDPELLSRVYEHGVEVVPHPTTGTLLVVPRPFASRP